MQFFLQSKALTILTIFLTSLKYGLVQKHRSFACVHHCPLAASVAFDVAAPEELAVALPDA